jgi:Na+/H+ antiporter NhaA
VGPRDGGDAAQLPADGGRQRVRPGRGGLVALAWANLPGGSYETVWTTRLSVRLGSWGITEELRRWVNDGLMTFFFFFVVGLEVRRELDMGELRERRRVAVPVMAALGGMVAPALIYLAINADSPGIRAWGVAMPTDPALALGVLALVGPRYPQRLRVFVLTLVVVDDIASLVVIAVAYTRDLKLVAVAIAILLFGVVYLLRFLRVWRGPAYFLVGVALWTAMLESGVHPAVAGVAMGLLATAYPPRRQRLERAVSLTRMFREQPTPEFARSARLSVDAAISTNERLQYLLHPRTSYVIVPLFALANAGVALRGNVLADAVRSPITIGVVVGLVGGKALGISGSSWLATRTPLAALPLTVPNPPARQRFGGRRHRLHGVAVHRRPVAGRPAAPGRQDRHPRCLRGGVAARLGGVPGDPPPATDPAGPQRGGHRATSRGARRPRRPRP